MPSFKSVAPISKSRIDLQPFSDDVPYQFEFEVCSAEGANDGVIPYGDSLSATYVIVVYDKDGADVTSEIIASHSRSGNIITVLMKYPATSGKGRYKLTFKITTTNGMKDEFDFGRIFAKDR